MLLIIDVDTLKGKNYNFDWVENTSKHPLQNGEKNKTPPNVLRERKGRWDNNGTIMKKPWGER